MASGPSLVGSAGAVSTGAAAGALTPAWGTGESRTNGNYGILLVVGTGGTTNPGTPAGWVAGAQIAAAANVVVRAFTRKLTGADAAPTIAGSAGMTWTAMLMEITDTAGAFVGVTVDRTGSNTTATGASQTATPPNLDTNPAEWFVVVAAAWYSSPATATLSLAVTNGTPSETDNGGTSTQGHYAFGWGQGTANSPSKQAATFTRPSANLSSTALIVVSIDRPTAAISETGTGADAVGSIKLSDTDTGSGVEAVGQIGVSDTGSGSGTENTPTVIIYASETGTSSEGQTIDLSSAEAGTSAETNAINAAVSASETGTSAEGASLALSNPETGSSAEGASLALGAAESGAGAEGNAVGLGATETGTGSDAGTPTTEILAADAGTSTEAAGINASLTDAETGSAAEGTPTVGLASADAGTSADTGSVVASITSSESGTGNETTGGLTLTGAEAGAGADTAGTVALGTTETGTSAEGARVGLTAADTGTSAEATTITALVTSTETGHGNDAQNAPVVIEAEKGVFTNRGTLHVAWEAAELTATPTAQWPSPPGSLSVAWSFGSLGAEQQAEVVPETSETVEPVWDAGTMRVQA